jgi:hypothetical protein
VKQVCCGLQSTQAQSHWCISASIEDEFAFFEQRATNGGAAMQRKAQRHGRLALQGYIETGRKDVAAAFEKYCELCVKDDLKPTNSERQFSKYLDRQ